MQMAVDFSFGQVEAICAALSDISSDKRTAFTSRLKHLMKSGIVDEDRPGGEFRPGRGKAAKFSFSQLMQIVIGVELLQAGTPPALAAKLVQGNWTSLRVGVHFGLYNEVEKRQRGDPREETYWILAPEALRELSSAGESWFDHYEAFESVYRADDLLKHFTQHEVGGMRGHYRRQLILNGTAITRATAFLISGEFNIATIQELQEDIYGEIARDQAALDKAVEELSLKGEISDESTKKLSKMIPVFRDFDAQWEAKISRVIKGLTPSQTTIMTTEFGAEVEVTQEDLLALRKLDLIAIQQGELVITDLGQAVGAESRKRAGLPDPDAKRSAEALQRAAKLVNELQKTRPDGRPAMIPVELAVLAKSGEAKTFNLEAWWKEMHEAALAKRLPEGDDSPVTIEQAIAEAGLGDPGGIWHVTGECEVALSLPGGDNLLIGGNLDAGSATPDAAIRKSAERLSALRSQETDHVVVFVPRDFMEEALKLDGQLVHWAFERRVLLATPANLRQILGTIAAVWKRAEGVIHVHSN
jgi:polyhydroxyalkanoate synthesis regulator phasin